MKAFVGIRIADSVRRVGVAGPPLRSILLYVRNDRMLLRLLLRMNARRRSATIRDFVGFRLAVIREDVSAILVEAILDSLVEGPQIFGDALLVNVDAVV